MKCQPIPLGITPVKHTTDTIPKMLDSRQVFLHGSYIDTVGSANIYLAARQLARHQTILEDVDFFAVSGVMAK